MQYKSSLINYRIKVNEFFSKATNKDYFNLFQPVMPKIDLTGKVAQAISALTEAVTIWLICQSKLSGVNQFFAVLISLLAIVLAVTAIEVGGRKGLQVITRAIVWRKLKNVWYWILFLFLVIITGFLFFQSFTLSTRGVNQSFKQSVQTAIIFDDGEYMKQHRVFVDEINANFDNQKKTLTNAFLLNYDAKEKVYNSKIEAVNAKVELHAQNMTKGVKWAKSHFNKQTKIKNELIAEKEAKLAELTANHTKDLKGIEVARMEAITKENSRHQSTLAKVENIINQNHTAEKTQAAFWGDLFSGLVGFMIVVAFVCIIVVEIFRRGSGIEIGYEENELPPNLLTIFLSGLNNRTFNLSYNLAQKWYVEKRDFDFLAAKKYNAIGFNYANRTANDLPSTLLNGRSENSYGDTICDNANCNNKFFKRSHNHRFCSDECRFSDWETKNGRPVTLRSKKKRKH